MKKDFKSLVLLMNYALNIFILKLSIRYPLRQSLTQMKDKKWYVNYLKIWFKWKNIQTWKKKDINARKILKRFFLFHQKIFPIKKIFFF
jgi:D-serine dehydratase